MSISGIMLGGLTDTTTLRGLSQALSASDTGTDDALQTNAATAATTDTTTKTADADSGASSTSRSSTSMVANLFYDSEYEDSEYVQATKSNFLTMSETSNQMNAAVTTVAAQIAVMTADLDADSARAVGGVFAEHLADESVGRISDQRVVEAHESALDEARENIETQTDGASAPADEGSASLPSGTSEGSGGAADASAATASDATSDTTSGTTQEAAPGAETQTDAQAAAPAAPAAAASPGVTLDLTV